VLSNIQIGDAVTHVLLKNMHIWKLICSNITGI